MPLLANYSSRKQTPVRNYGDFIRQTTPFNIVVINSKQIYEYLVRGIVRLEDFDLLIFEDISLTKEPQQVLIMKDFYMHRV